MPTEFDILKARLISHKETLSHKTPKDKDGQVSVNFAEQCNALIDDIKKASPEVCADLRQVIPCHGQHSRLTGKTDLSFLELEMILNEVLAVLDALRADH